VALRASRHGDTEAALDADRSAVRLYRGDLCADLPYEEWTIFPRERLRMLYGDVLDRLSDLQWRSADYEGCIATAGLILEQDPCREDAHRLLMRCYVAQGRPHQALRQFEACRRMLKAQLDAIPSRATMTAYLDVRDQGDQRPP
jgi:DNA-binding SARP family transcriptional activator